MRNFFTLDGVDSRDYNTYIAKSNAFDSAERDIESFAVPGRNGELTISHNRFKNFHAQVSVYIPSKMQTYTGALAAELLSKPGYRRYEEAIRPELYRMARYAGPFELDVSDHYVAGITLNFDCQPQLFLKSGDIPLLFEQNEIISNPTKYGSKPLIRVFGEGYVLINGIRITVSSAPTAGYTDIDCETMDAFCGTENRNAYVTFASDTIELDPGDNSVLLNDVTVEITPRWWTV